LNLGGNVPSAEGLLLLLRAIYEYHQLVPGCQLHLGGVAGASFSETLGARVTKLPLAQADTHSLLQKVVLRRQRLLADGDGGPVLIVLQLQRELLCRDVNETIRMLEDACAAAPGQIAVLAESSNKTHKQTAAVAHASLSHHHILYLRVLKATIRCAPGTHALTPRQIAACLEELATESHPSISCLDIARVFLPELDGHSGTSAAPFRRRSAFRPVSQQLIAITSNNSATANRSAADGGAGTDRGGEAEERDELETKPIARLQMTMDVRPLVQRVEYIPPLLPAVLEVTTESPDRQSTIASLDRRSTSASADRPSTVTTRPSAASVQRRSTYRRRASTATATETFDEGAEGHQEASSNSVETTPEEEEGHTAPPENSRAGATSCDRPHTVVQAVCQLVEEKQMAEEDAVIWYGLAGETYAIPVLKSLYQQGARRSQAHLVDCISNVP
jgi:hypothetical protein